MSNLARALKTLQISFEKAQLREKERAEFVAQKSQNYRECTVDDFLEKETTRNEKEFNSFLENLEKRYGPGKSIFMREQQFVADFDTKRDAFTAGNLLYPDKLFSIHTIEKFNEKIFSHFP